MHGANDPVVSPATATADVTEDLITVSSGSVFDSVTDADTHDVHTITAVNGSGGNVGTPVGGTYGTLQIDADGTAEYVLNNAAANVQALGGGITVIDSFTYTVSDGHGSFATTTLNVNVHGTNDAPVAVADSFTTDEDTQLSNLSVLANDTDVDNGAPVTVARINGTAIAVNGTVGIIGGAVTLNANQTLTFTPNPNVNGDVSFAYTAKDSSGAESAQATVTIHINSVNDAPIAAPNSFTTAEDTATTFNLLANDSDTESGKPNLVSQVNGQAIAVGGTVAVTGGSVKLNSDQTLTFTPNTDFNGTGLSFTYVAKDVLGGLESNTATVTYSVTPVNDAPVAVFDAVSGTEDTPVTFDVRTNDTDVDGPFPLNVTQINGTAISVGSPVTLADGAQVALNANGTLTYTPAANANGPRGFNYTVSDGTASSVGNVTVTLAAVNDAPVANDNGSMATPIAIVEDTPTAINVLANDNDVDGPGSLAIASINGTTITTNGQTVAVAGGTVSVNTTNGVLTFTPNADSTGPTNFDYVAKDGLGATSNSAKVYINVTPVNDAPENTAPASVTATEDVSTPIALSVADVDSNVTVTLSVDHGVLNVTGAGVSGSGSNTVTIASTTPAAMNTILASLSYQGVANYNGDDTLTMVTSDGSLSDTDTVAITVNTVNDNPVVDLNGGSAGIDRSDIPTYTSGAATINVASAIASVTDVENAISKITLHLTADSGATDGVGTEGLTLPPGASAFLASIGFTVTGEGTDTIEVIANAPGGVSPSVFEGILKTVRYHDNDTTFGFNPEDRSIAVTATDAAGGVSNAAYVHIDLAANVTDVNGAGQLDHFTGANLADTIRGNGGDDTMEGRGGNDTIYGGTEAGDAGHDTAVFTGNQANYTVTRTGPGVYTVADSVLNRDGTDTVHELETLHFNGDNTDLLLDAPIQVFNAGGNVLLASFQANQLDLAVNYANSHAGANVIELRSSSSPFTASVWPVDITEAVTIKAVGGTATVNAGGNSGFAIESGAVLGAGDVVRLEGLNITGTGAANTVGVSFNGAYGGASDGTIQLINTSVSNFGRVGLNISGGGTGLTVNVGDDPATAMAAETAAFSGSGGANPLDNGTGDILFFGFTGAATLTNVTVTGSSGATSSDNGIQIAGFDPADKSVDGPIGTISLTNVAVSGTYEKNLVYIQGYDKFDGLSFSAVNLGSSASSAAWAALFIDGGPQGIAYTPAGTVDGTIDSTLSLAGVSISGGTYGTNPAFAALGGKPIVVNGTLTDDMIAGTGAAEAFNGLTGDDTINAGGGNDLVLYNVGDGHDTVDGEGDTDTLALINFTAGVPSATSATFTVTESTGHLIVNTDGGAPAEVDALGMESLQVQLGNGGDAVTLTGNLAGAGISTGPGGIIIAGGTGSDTLDASALASANAITFSDLGGGNDTFKAANVVANDVVNGAGGTGDTANYSVASAAVTIDLTAGTANGTSVGSDIISNFENAIGGASGDTLHGTTGVNAFTGNGGVDAVTYTGTITAGMIKTNGLGGWTVTSGGEGTDTLSTIEVVQGADPVGTPTGKFLLVGNGGYATIADAYAAAVDGDTIMLAPGTYAGDFTIGKAINVVGANYNVPGASMRGAESVLTGHWTVNAGGPVTIDGVEFLNNTPYTSGIDDTRLTLASSATVDHSIFYNTRPGGNKPISDIAINVTATTGAVSIANSYFTGDSHGKYFAPNATPLANDPASASWGGGSNVGGDAGAIVWHGGSSLDIGGNTIQYARTGLTLLGDNTLLNIHGNTLDTNGTGITALNWHGTVTQLTNTTFTNVDNELNARSNTAAITIDLGGTGNTSDNFFSVLGTIGADTIIGTAGKDAILAEQGDDTVRTGAGNDSVFFNAGATAGNDTVDGGSELALGKDTLIVSNTSSVNNTLDPGDAGDPATSNSGSPGSTAVTFTMTPTVGNVVTTTDGAGTDSSQDILITAQTTAGATPLGSVTADEIEDVLFNLGSGGDTVVISGDFTATSLSPNTITINGTAATAGHGETVDASGLISADDIVFTGGAGDDVFKVNPSAVHNIFHGAAGTDTVNYSAFTTAVTVDLGAATPTATGFTTIDGVENIVGGSVNDSLTGTSGINQITGGGGIDTSGYGTTASSAAIFGFNGSGHWTVTIGGLTDTLIGVERLTFSDKTVLLVDHSGTNVGGFQSVQSAIDAAAGGETILIRGGITYNEVSAGVGGGDPQGLYINKANLTLQGVTTAGALITDSAVAQSSGPTIVSAEQNQFGANHWVDVGGDGVVFNGVHLQAGAQTNNKLLEIWADAVSVTNSFIDVYEGGANYTFAVAIYVNDNGTTSSEVSSYTIADNILNEGVIIANGVGDPTLHTVGSNQRITDNDFIGTFNYVTGEGRYDTVVINGKVAGIGWLLEPTQIPTVTGNSFAGNETPFLLRGSDDNPLNMPTVAQVEDFLANNGDADLTYAYVTNGGVLRTDDPDFGAGVTHRFVVANRIDTLNLALDEMTYFSPASTDQVYPDQRIYMQSGDTVHVQSAGGTVNSQIMVDNLTVQATANSADLNLTLATTYADTTAIPGGGVQTVTIADYDTVNHLGANVDVTGNALDNTITGNSGANALAGGGGNDTLHGGGGNDQLYGGVGGVTPVDSGAADRATYDDVVSNYTVVTHLDGNGFADGFVSVAETAVNKGASR